MNLSWILWNPFSASAFFSSVLRKALFERKKGNLVPEIASVSWMNGTLVVKVSSRIAATEFSFVVAELETAVTLAANELGFPGKVRVTVK